MSVEQKLLELYTLTKLESSGQLDHKSEKRYVELVEELKSRNVEIPFGIEI